eukprot:Hpha_TRINITY_DN13589_c0_g1::TRINITY_DN13589_c0_g1_i2::g.111428::m.111428/K04950/CNGA3; cyclic nucleotide gated channel alpha 3
MSRKRQSDSECKLAEQRSLSGLFGPSLGSPTREELKTESGGLKLDFNGNIDIFPSMQQTETSVLTPSASKRSRNSEVDSVMSPRSPTRSEGRGLSKRGSLAANHRHRGTIVDSQDVCGRLTVVESTLARLVMLLEGRAGPAATLDHSSTPSPSGRLDGSKPLETMLSNPLIRAARKTAGFSKMASCSMGPGSASMWGGGTDKGAGLFESQNKGSRPSAFGVSSLPTSLPSGVAEPASTQRADSAFESAIPDRPAAPPIRAPSSAGTPARVSIHHTEERVGTGDETYTGPPEEVVVLTVPHSIKPIDGIGIAWRKHVSGDLMVASVEEGSLAGEAGVFEGMVVRKIGKVKFPDQNLDISVGSTDFWRALDDARQEEGDDQAAVEITFIGARLDFEEEEEDDDDDFHHSYFDETEVATLLPDSTARRMFDGLYCLFALIQYISVTTQAISVGFGDELAPGLIGLYSLCTLFNVVGIFVNFRTAFLSGWELVGDEEEELPDVSSHYIKTWLAFDVCYTVPWDLIFYKVHPVLFCMGSFSRCLPAVRVPFLFKSSSPLDVNRPMVVKGGLFCFYMCACIHFLAIMWFLVGGFNTDDDDFYGKYITAIYWSVTTMTTVGYGDVTPEGKSAKILSLLSMLLGAGLFAYTMGNISTLLINEDPFQSRMQEKKKNLAALFKHYAIPLSLQKETFLVFPTIIDRVLTQTEDTLGALPPYMQQKLTHQIKLRLIRNVPLFSGAPAKVSSMLAVRFTQHLVSPGVYVVKQGEVGEQLFILNKGLVDVTVWDGEKERRVGSIRCGSWFGEVSLLRGCTRTASVKTSTACELFALHRRDFRRILRLFPEFEKRVIKEIGLRELEQKKVIAESAAERAGSPTGSLEGSIGRKRRGSNAVLSGLEADMPREASTLLIQASESFIDLKSLRGVEKDKEKEKSLSISSKSGTPVKDKDTLAPGFVPAASGVSPHQSPGQLGLSLRDTLDYSQKKGMYKGAVCVDDLGAAPKGELATPLAPPPLSTPTSDNKPFSPFEAAVSMAESTYSQGGHSRGDRMPPGESLEHSTRGQRSKTRSVKGAPCTPNDESKRGDFRQSIASVDPTRQRRDTLASETGFMRSSSTTSEQLKDGRPRRQRGRKSRVASQETTEFDAIILAPVSGRRQDESAQLRGA